jgi:hypothetical protein
MKRYPYLVVYRASDERIEIIAVAHGRRRPAFLEASFEEW